MRLLTNLAIAVVLAGLGVTLIWLGGVKYEGRVPPLPCGSPPVARVGDEITLSIPTGDRSVDGHYGASLFKLVMQEQDADGKWLAARKQPEDVQVKDNLWAQEITASRSRHASAPSAESPVRLRVDLRFPDEPAYRGKQFRLAVAVTIGYPAMLKKPDSAAGRSGKFENRSRDFKIDLPMQFLTSAQETAYAHAGIIRFIFGLPGLLCAVMALFWLMGSILKANDRVKQRLAEKEKPPEKEKYKW